MAIKTGVVIAEEKLNSPDIDDDDGSVNVEHFPIPEDIDGDDYLKRVWGTAARGINMGEAADERVDESGKETADESFVDESSATPMLNIVIETKAGEIRRGADKNGTPWEVIAPNDYGYIADTVGADGQGIDCHVGPMPAAETAFPVVVDQIDPDTGKFDEHKCMLGFQSIEAAIKAYENAYPGGDWQKRVGAVNVFTSMAEFSAWVKTANLKKPCQCKPVKS